MIHPGFRVFRRGLQGFSERWTFDCFFRTGTAAPLMILLAARSAGEPEGGGTSGGTRLTTLPLGAHIGLGGTPRRSISLGPENHHPENERKKKRTSRRKLLKLAAYATPTILSVSLAREAGAQALGSPPDPPRPPPGRRHRW